MSIFYPKLTYFNDVQGESVTVFLYRFLFFAFYCWSISQLAIRPPFRFLRRSIKLLDSFISILVIAISAILFYYLFLWTHSLLFFEIVEPERSGVGVIWVVMVVTSTLLGWLLRFQQKQRINALERERLIREKVQSELQALNNQINPHFLFNSLNTLKYFMQENQKDSIEFVDKLAELYRYILRSGDKGLVTIQEELDFLEIYIYLIKARYEDNFDVDINLKVNTETQLIPILSLQLLIENAIKHNEISIHCPLQVKIYSEKGAIIVENKIQPRTRLVQSMNQGLKNLCRRYQLLTKKDIKIEQDTIFKVTLPIK